MLCPGELGEEPHEPGDREIHSQLSQVKLIDDKVCPVLRHQGLGLCRETNTHDTLPLRVKVLGHVLFLPASIPTSTFFLLLAQVLSVTVASLGLLKGVTQTSSQSNAHSLHSAPPKSSSSILPPWSAETSRRTACSLTSGTGFLREVQGQARSPRDAPGGPEYSDCRRWRGPSREEFFVVL